MTIREGNIRETNELSYRNSKRTCRGNEERSLRTSAEVAEDFVGGEGEATAGEAAAGEARSRWLEDEPQVSVRGLLEQGPAATEEAASFGGKISFGGKKIRRSYDAVARFQLQSRAGNHDFLR